MELDNEKAVTKKKEEDNNEDKKKSYLWLIILMVFILVFGVALLLWPLLSPKGNEDGKSYTLEDALTILRDDIKKKYDDGYSIEGKGIYEVLTSGDATRTYDNSKNAFEDLRIQTKEDGVTTTYTFAKEGETYVKYENGVRNEISEEEANDYMVMGYEDYLSSTVADFDREIALLTNWLMDKSRVSSYAVTTLSSGDLHLNVKGELDDAGLTEFSLSYSAYHLEKWESTVRGLTTTYEFRIS